MQISSDEPIKDMAELVESGLPWNMVIYGENVEHQLATSQDPVKKKFWREKEVVEYQPFPYERVRMNATNANVDKTYLEQLRTQS